MADEGNQRLMMRRTIELGRTRPGLLKAALRNLLHGYTTGGTFIPAAICTPSGCILAQKATNKGKKTTKIGLCEPDGSINFQEEPAGYVKMKIPDLDQKTEYYAHHIAYVVGNLDKINDPEWCRNALDAANQISHLCGQTKCFNSKHLVAEGDAYQRTRDNCRFLPDLACPTCLSLIKPCPHKPPCIRKTPTAMACKVTGPPQCSVHIGSQSHGSASIAAQLIASQASCGSYKSKVAESTLRAGDLFAMSTNGQ